MEQDERNAPRKRLTLEEGMLFLKVDLDQGGRDTKSDHQNGGGPQRAGSCGGQ